MDNQKLFIGAVIGLVVGGTGGWFLGSWQAMQAINKQISESAAQQQAAQDQGLGAQTGVTGTVETNPYQNVKTNPFE